MLFDVSVAAADLLCPDWYCHRCRARNSDRRDWPQSAAIMLMTWVIDRLAQLRLSPKVILETTPPHLSPRVEGLRLLQTSPGAFFRMIACNLLAHVASVVEVYVALRMLGFNPQVSQAYIIESLTKVINFAFAFVPGTIGVYEGGTEVILQGAGFCAGDRRRPGARAQSCDRFLDVNWSPGTYLAHRCRTRGVEYWIAARVYNVLWIAWYFQISLIDPLVPRLAFLARLSECC